MTRKNRIKWQFTFKQHRNVKMHLLRTSQMAVEKVSKECETRAQKDEKTAKDDDNVIGWK